VERNHTLPPAISSVRFPPVADIQLSWQLRDMTRHEPIRPDRPQSNLEWLQDFYASLCNGDWEHSYGFNIENIDNPGWSFKFELTDTFLDGRPYYQSAVHRSETDWVICKLDGHCWVGYGGALNLDDLIGQFREWAESELQRQGL
jgi:hypothetical protein